MIIMRNRRAAPHTAARPPTLIPLTVSYAALTKRLRRRRRRGRKQVSVFFGVCGRVHGFSCGPRKTPNSTVPTPFRLWVLRGPRKTPNGTVPTTLRLFFFSPPLRTPLCAYYDNSSCNLSVRPQSPRLSLFSSRCSLVQELHQRGIKTRSFVPN